MRDQVPVSDRATKIATARSKFAAALAWHDKVQSYAGKDVYIDAEIVRAWDALRVAAQALHVLESAP